MLNPPSGPPFGVLVARFFRHPSLRLLPCCVVPNIGPTPDSLETEPLEPVSDPYAVLRNRNLVLYLTGRFVASLGQQMLTVAVGWELYERTHSPLMLGLVGLTQMAPMILFTLPAGHVADNYDRKRINLLTTAFIACASLGLTLISALQASVAWIYFCLFVAGTAGRCLFAARSPGLPPFVTCPLL